MGFSNTPQVRGFMARLRLLLRVMAVGFAAIFALGVGFLVMIFSAMLVPLITWWRLRRLDEEVEVVKKGEFIDAEYEIINEDKK